jgi:hypothetical protein
VNIFSKRKINAYPEFWYSRIRDFLFLINGVFRGKAFWVYPGQAVEQLPKEWLVLLRIKS